MFSQDTKSGQIIDGLAGAILVFFVSYLLIGLVTMGMVARGEVVSGTAAWLTAPWQMVLYLMKNHFSS